ncbi:YcxB family protein [Leptospira koniambonensis]|uniref:YcxB family protein n=1 Tax=Leptospira koniambonensis TaxID=2484950 RepID=UPI003EBCCF8E
MTLNTVRKILEKGNNFALFQGTVFEFSEKEISSKSKNSDTVYQWAAIKKYIETEEYFFLYTSASSAIILPKSKLGLNQTEISALKQLFSQKIHPSTNY